MCSVWQSYKILPKPTKKVYPSNKPLNIRKTDKDLEAKKNRLEEIKIKIPKRVPIENEEEILRDNLTERKRRVAKLRETVQQRKEQHAKIEQEFEERKHRIIKLKEELESGPNQQQQKEGTDLEGNDEMSRRLLEEIKPQIEKLLKKAEKTSKEKKKRKYLKSISEILSSIMIKI